MPYTCRVCNVTAERGGRVGQSEPRGPGRRRGPAGGEVTGARPGSGAPLAPTPDLVGSRGHRLQGSAADTPQLLHRAQTEAARTRAGRTARLYTQRRYGQTEADGGNN